MAVGLINKPNTDPVSSDYPYGKTRDKTVTVPGTKWDNITMSDYIQFHEKMMAEAGVSPNGDLDNETNGWQIYEAFRKLTRPYKVMSGKIMQLLAGAPVVTYYENTFGVTPVPTRTDAGIYKLTSTGLFAGKPWFITGNGSNINTKIAGSINDDELQIFTSRFDQDIPGFVLEDDCMINVSFEIRVYD